VATAKADNSNGDLVITDTVKVGTTLLHNVGYLIRQRDI
jgi:hypothetical protein